MSAVCLFTSLIGWDSSFQGKVYWAQANVNAVWRLWPCQRQSEKWWTALTRQALRILAAQIKSLPIHKWCVRPCYAHGPLCLVDVIRVQRMCECACVSVCFVCECLARRRGWSGLDSILCDSTSGLASISSDTPHSLPRVQHFDCSFTVFGPSLCF